MRYTNRIEKLFWLSVICLTIMSATILIMPFVVSVTNEKRMLVVATGMLFWGSAIVGYTSIIKANKERIRYISKQPNDDLSMGCRVGIMNFFSNIPSTVADVSMIMSFILFIIIIFTEHNNSYLSYVLLFILILSLNMHGLFNGRIYKTIKIKHKRREKHL